MSKVCKECGHQFDDNVQACPNCGCPVKRVSATIPIDDTILNKGRSTEAELTVSKFAESILKWGNILSIVGLIGFGIGGLISAKQALFAPVICLLYGFSFFVVIRLLSKIIWGVITLFVNISTTLKRIEILLEQNGTNNL